MKSILILAIFVFFISLGKAQANREGHGGGAFICPDSAQSEFYDLWVGENPQWRSRFVPYGFNMPELKFPQSSDPVEIQVQRVFERLKSSPSLYDKMMHVYQYVRNAKVVPVPPGVELAWPADEYNKYIKAGCAAKALILYHDGDLPSDDFVDLDTDGLKGLTNTQQAALWVHETVYKFLRMTTFAFLDKEDQPILAQEVVALLFSNQRDEYVHQMIHSIAGFNFSPGTRGLESFAGPNQYYVADYFDFFGPVIFDADLAPEFSDPKCKRWGEIYYNEPRYHYEESFGAIPYMPIHDIIFDEGYVSPTDFERGAFLHQKTKEGTPLNCALRFSVYDPISGQRNEFIYQKGANLVSVGHDELTDAISLTVATDPSN